MLQLRSVNRLKLATVTVWYRLITDNYAYVKCVKVNSSRA